MVATTIDRAPARARRGYFYVWLAAYCAVFAIGLFAATYWLQLAAGTFIGGGPLLHLHAALFTAWALLLVSQAWLVAQGRVLNHRAFGVAGVALASAMVVVGMALSIRLEMSYQARGFGQAAYAFFMFPFCGIAEFAVFFALAVANTARPEWHKRLMMVATVGLLQAPAGRVGFLIATHGGGPGQRPGLAPPPPIEGVLGGALIASTALVAGMIYDWRTRGRPHAAYLIGPVVVIGIGAASPAITATHAWDAMVDWWVAFAH